MAGYNKSPKQKAYRRALAQARRKRGIMGKGGDDISHNRNGTLSRKSMKINRAANGHGNNSRYA